MATSEYAALEAAAEALLARHAALLGDEPPIDVDALAEDGEGLDVAEAPDLRLITGAPPLPETASLSGLLVPLERRIWVNAIEARRSPGRRRFTVAHELGHWVLHAQGAGAAQSRWCRTDEVAEAGSTSALESEANRFAAAVLMPRALVVAESERVRLNVGVLARRFDVSEQAMRIRLDVLSLLPEYMR